MKSLSLQPPTDVPGYAIDRLIGLGGMGEVYLARQGALDRLVALKFLGREAGDASEEDEARFRREAELMARASHPNIATIFDFGRCGGRAYLVMEYVEGGDLRARMTPDRPMPLGAVRSILGPIVEAVRYLHSLGIVHRDLKPENILMLRGETPKVSDFGLSALGFAAGLDRPMGTPGYVAPEQQYGLSVDDRADQFSLAALGYEMATGRRPLGRFPPPSSLNPKVGPAFEAALLRGLSEDPADRFATVVELGEALDRGLAGARRPPRIGGPLAASIATLAGASAWIFSVATTSKTSTPRPLAPPPAAASAASAAARPSPGPACPARLVARSVGMTLVRIEPGEFPMGARSDDSQALPSDRPRHRVRISRPFFLGEKEVTVAQFRAFADQTGRLTTAETKPADGGPWGGFVVDPKTNQKVRKPGVSWRNPGLKSWQADDEPVLQVSWDDAVAFCEWLSAREGRVFRLPTEAQWEFACRAGSDGRWCFGDDPARLDQYAWNPGNAGFRFHPVGKLRPNAFGLFDMHGNAWEWCGDAFGPYDDAEAVDPLGPSDSGERVLRGGSIGRDRLDRRGSASRHKAPPDVSYLSYGFRVCSPCT